MNLNLAIIGGNLTRDPELKILSNGTSACLFSLATNRKFKSNGTQKEETEFHSIACYGRIAESVSSCLKKGDLAWVQGRIHTLKWENGGIMNYKTEIVADHVQFGPRRGSIEREIEKGIETEQVINY